LLRKIPPSKDKATQSFKKAREWWKESENSLKGDAFNSSILSSYMVTEQSLPGLETYQSTLHIAINEFILKMVFGAAESLLSCETYQFEDYSKVVSSLFDPEQRAQRRKEVFPKDCEKAFEMGERFARGQK